MHCTDAFLSEFLLGFLKPGDHSAAKTILSKMDAADKMYIPHLKDFLLTLCEKVLDTETCNG